jgi:hypothetical protein
VHDEAALLCGFQKDRVDAWSAQGRNSDGRYGHRLYKVVPGVRPAGSDP